MPTDRRIVLLVVLAALAAVVLAGRLLGPGGSGAGAEVAAPVEPFPAGAATSPDAGPVLVHVVGAVRRPGVYRLTAGSRVRDAVRAAGGARSGARLAGLNLAARLADGEQIAVPGRGVASVAAGGAGTADAIVHLNSADEAALDGLDGIGPALAARIVEYRTAHGGFRSVDELADVPGIGPAKLEAIRDRVAP